MSQTYKRPRGVSTVDETSPAPAKAPKQPDARRHNPRPQRPNVAKAQDEKARLDALAKKEREERVEKAKQKEADKLAAQEAGLGKRRAGLASISDLVQSNQASVAALSEDGLPPPSTVDEEHGPLDDTYSSDAEETPPQRVATDKALPYRTSSTQASPSKPLEPPTRSDAESRRELANRTRNEFLSPNSIAQQEATPTHSVKPPAKSSSTPAETQDASASVARGRGKGRGRAQGRGRGEDRAQGRGRGRGRAGSQSGKSSAVVLTGGVREGFQSQYSPSKFSKKEGIEEDRSKGVVRDRGLSDEDDVNERRPPAQRPRSLDGDQPLQVINDELSKDVERQEHQASTAKPTKPRGQSELPDWATEILFTEILPTFYDLIGVIHNPLRPGKTETSLALLQKVYDAVTAKHDYNKIILAEKDPLYYVVAQYRTEWRRKLWELAKKVAKRSVMDVGSQMTGRAAFVNDALNGPQTAIYGDLEDPKTGELATYAYASEYVLEVYATHLDERANSLIPQKAHKGALAMCQAAVLMAFKCWETGAFNDQAVIGKHKGKVVPAFSKNSPAFIEAMGTAAPVAGLSESRFGRLDAKALANYGSDLPAEEPKTEGTTGLRKQVYVDPPSSPPAS